MRIAIHLGLGDAIILSPIIAKLAETDKISIPCWKHNYESVKSFFVNLPNIEIIPRQIQLDTEWLESCSLKIGYCNNVPLLPNECFVEWFFRQADFDLSERNKYCPLQKAAENVEQEKTEELNYIFVHDKHECPINRLLLGKSDAIISPFNADGSILKYANLIKNAKEIHCIDSSFLHLSEALETTGELFYHRYSRNAETGSYNFQKKWHIFE